MNFIWNIRMKMDRFMTGRYGTDSLNRGLIILWVIFLILGIWTGSVWLYIPQLILCVLVFFRMLSRNHEKRLAENRKYIELTSNWKLKSRQFTKRLKNRRDYKYFKCPNCKVLLRLKRGCGEKDITCVRCGYQFKQKS